MESLVPEQETSSESDLEDNDLELSEVPVVEGPSPAVYRETIDPDHVDSDAIKVVRRLTRHGHWAYLVGGSVRDLLLGGQPKDFDVATSARPEQVRRLFRNCRIIGRRFRLAHVLFGGGKIIETATFRRDPGQGDIQELPSEEAVGDNHDAVRLVPGQRPESDDLLIRHDNVFGEPFEDAIRRDFTINGLFYDVEHDAVIDYVGGVPDLRRRVVRTIGAPGVRLREDPVRILRAIKFSARLDLGIDPLLYGAIVKHRQDLERAARPRVLEEVLRLLRSGAAHRSVYLLWDTGVLAVIAPELASFLDDEADEDGLLWKRLQSIDARQRDGRLPSDSVLVASFLLGPMMEWVEGARDPSVAFEEFFDEVAIRLAIPRRMKDRIRSMAVAQRRLETGKLGALPRRDFFADAATLFAVQEEAKGGTVPSWALEPQVAEVDEADAGRRRRRRRRRRLP